MSERSGAGGEALPPALRGANSSWTAAAETGGNGTGAWVDPAAETGGNGAGAWVDPAAVTGGNGAGAWVDPAAETGGNGAGAWVDPGVRDRGIIIVDIMISMS